ncbi:PhoH-like ATPase [Orenia metallireducens]|uniref:PhoH-like ATPase n=1 Tax=Orenia metallireducens TaxID=1413210 RepID=A0A285HQC5_9FIRM|nr:PhoH family protein [Orenia metallireducens]PRX25074.1 PhoH-like ATPase [Orenia metallireducens]SNY37932.1 PhoH-like ATPase [Orenia metallireducens]
MEKIYVLDTNVILHDPKSIFSFEDNKVIIPMVVIEEVDDQKKRQDSVGSNARIFSRYLDELRKKGKLCDGVELDDGGRIKVELNHQLLTELPKGLDPNKPDNRILATTLGLQEDGEIPVILVTKDINMRIKADAMGLAAEDYATDAVNIDELYSGIKNINVPSDKINALFRDKKLELNELDLEERLYPNEFINLEDEFGGSQSALCCYDEAKNKLIPFIFNPTDIWGIKPRNREQKCAFELLLNDNIKLVTLVGKAGTGKTLLALAAGLQKVVEDKSYKRLIVTRPIVPMGNDLGFLPGDKDEKLAPWMRPIFDNMEFLVGGKDENGASAVADLKEMGLIEMEAITYIRGRSIPNQFIIVDEAQNLTPHELKTIITRAGENTKIVLTGDPYQIDHPYLDSNSNGLTYVVERLKDKALVGHMTLYKGERSQLAEIAASSL